MNRGYLCALLAYGTWGVVPIFWRQLQSVPPGEIIVYRVIFSLLTLLVLITLLGKLRAVPGFFWNKRNLLFAAASSLLITFNWGLYVYAVNSGNVLESSLGYFINPLINILLGTLLLKERLPMAQKIALGIATLGVTMLVVAAGVLPWIALGLAFSFALYGLARKQSTLGAVEGSLFETALIFPAALVTLFVFYSGTNSLFFSSGKTTLLLVASGLITAFPLYWFSVAARSLKLSTMGFFQFLSPTLQFLCALFVFNEPFSKAQALSFSLIWLALGINIISVYWDSRNLRERPSSP